MLEFFNLRSELYWRLREAFDPANNTGIAIPPDKRLKADLCAVKWSLSGYTIKVASREEMIKLIGRSPDFGSAIMLTMVDTPNLTLLQGEMHQLSHGSKGPHYDPLQLGGGNRASTEWDPFSRVSGGS